MHAARKAGFFSTVMAGLLICCGGFITGQHARTMLELICALSKSSDVLRVCKYCNVDMPSITESPIAAVYFMNQMCANLMMSCVTMVLFWPGGWRFYRWAYKMM
jgi:hypothetical protein